MAREEFDPEGTEPTNEPLRLKIISNLLVFSNFLIHTARVVSSNLSLYAAYNFDIFVQTQ